MSNRHIFLELATGGDLFSYLAKHGMLCEGEAKYIAFQLMKGLEVSNSSSLWFKDLPSPTVSASKANFSSRYVDSQFCTMSAQFCRSQGKEYKLQYHAMLILNSPKTSC
jgi:serine/threonine protein kinase